MKMRLPLLLLAFVLSVSPALAGERLETAMAALAAIETNPAKFQSYCAIMLGVAAIAADSEAAGSIDAKKLEEDFRIIDAEYEELSQLGEELVDGSDDAQAIDDASDRILAKCESDTRLVAYNVTSHQSGHVTSHQSGH